MLLGVQKMTLNRWLRPGSGEFGPDQTYMIPPKYIAAGPVWVKSDVERFAEEVGRQRALAQPKEPVSRNGRVAKKGTRKPRAKRPARA